MVPELVAYRPAVGFPRVRVGSDCSVWADGANSSRRGAAKLDAGKVAAVRRLHAEGIGYRRLARRFKVSAKTIRYVVKGWTWPDATAARPPRWRRLKPFDRGGRPYVVLHAGGRKTSRSVESLHREAFGLPPRDRERNPPPPLPTLPPVPGHDQAEQERERPAAERPPPVLDDDEGYRRGEANPRAKMTEAKVIEARRLHREGASYKELCERYGIGRVTLFNIVSGRSWVDAPMVD